MFCEHCGAQIDDDVRFCTECGEPVGPAAQEAPASDAGATGEYPPPAPSPAPSAKKQVNGKVVAAVIAGALVVGGGAGAAFAVISGSQGKAADSSAQQQTSSGTSVEVTVSDGEKSGSSSSSAQTTPEATSGSSSSSSSSTSTTSTTSNTTTTTTDTPASASGTTSSGDASGIAHAGSNVEQVRTDAAEEFCRTYWTNVSVANAEDDGYSPIMGWSSRCAAFVDPSSDLYGQLLGGTGAGVLDAEDICTSATLSKLDGNVATVTVGVAAHRENPTAGWSTQTTHTYVMEITFNDDNLITGFTSRYTDPSTGKTYSVSH